MHQVFFSHYIVLLFFLSRHKTTPSIFLIEFKVFIICMIFSILIPDLYFIPTNIYIQTNAFSFSRVPVQHFELQTIFRELARGSLNYSQRAHFRILNLSYKSVDGFYLIPFARFGNNVYQFIRSLTYSDLFGYKRLIIPYNFLFFKRNFDVNGISVEIANNDTDYSKFLFGHYYHPAYNAKTELSFKYFDYFRDEFLRSFPNMSLDPNDLYMHLRSGDIYFQDDHPNYGQPPINFYFDVMKYKKWNNIYLLSDGFNPMYNLLINSGAIHYSNYSFYDVIAIAVNCYNLAFGKTTFMISLSFLAKRFNNLFTFNLPTYRMKPHLNCDPDDEYVNKIVNNWTNTADKISVLFSSKCRKWEYFPNKPYLDTSKERFHNDDIWLYWVR